MMTLNEKELPLKQIRSWGYKEWKDSLPDTKVHRLLIGVSGYESRSKDWLSKTICTLPPSEQNVYFVLGFNDHKDVLNRAANDKFYKSHEITVHMPEYGSAVDMVIKTIKKEIEVVGKDRLEVHLDYSSMPRSWYCTFPSVLAKCMRPQDEVFFWYTPGEYGVIEYPTAGVEDFNVFAGQPSLRSGLRTHFFGLGFDRIRSHAIWSVLDPERLVCFYVSPGTCENYDKRVQDDNKDVLAAADFIFAIDITDFASAYSRIAGVVREFQLHGDVVLVPDGPKPLILATSLVPQILAYRGITCFHVSRRKSDQSKPVDVKAIGPAFGFSFSILSHNPIKD